MNMGYTLIWLGFSIIVGVLYYYFLASSLKGQVGQKLSGVMDISRSALARVGPARWAILSLVLAAMAQITLFLSVGQSWDPKVNDSFALIPGFLLYALAGIVSIRALRLVGDSAPALAVARSEGDWRRPGLSFRMTSLGCAILLAYHTAHAKQDDPTGYAFLALWILSIFLFVADILYEDA